MAKAPGTCFLALHHDTTRLNGVKMGFGVSEDKSLCNGFTMGVIGQNSSFFDARLPRGIKKGGYLLKKKVKFLRKKNLKI